jgi:hemerythrin-like metal-binding protein
VSLTWDESLSVGVPRIDDQHKKLIGLANALVEAIRRGQGQAVIRPLVQELREYTVTHFRDEEAFMEHIAYPELDAQRHAHRIIVMRVKEFQRAIYERQEIEPAELRELLREWLLGHILGMDREIGRYIAENEAKLKSAGRDAD